MRMAKQKYIDAGRIVNTHGVRGEVKIEVWLDSAEALRRLPRLYLAGEEKKILAARVHKDHVIATLEGVEDVNAAMALKGRTVQIDRADAKLEPGAFFLQDILGASVVDESGAEIGRLSEVLELPGQRVYVVKGDREHLIPAVPAFVLKTDADAGVITVRLIEGM